MNKSWMYILLGCAAAIVVAVLVKVGIWIYESSQGKYQMEEKPVLYLYPTEPTTVTVKFVDTSNLSITYPEYSDGWTYLVDPNGMIEDKYSYLFWETDVHETHTFTEGACIGGSDTIYYLEKSLLEMGYTHQEAQDFITYWAPKMIGNKYNIIQFIDASAELLITPTPDTVLRTFMVWKASDTPISLPEQVFHKTERHGFTVVEWGGAVLSG